MDVPLQLVELALISFAALLLLLSGAGTQAQVPENPELQAALMRQLFGNFDAAERYAVWSPPAVPKRFAEFFVQGRGRTTVLLDEPFTNAGSLRRLVVFATVPDEEGWGCHPCGSLLSAALLASTKDQNWKVTARESFLTAGGQWGKAPRVRLRRLGRSRLALEVTDRLCFTASCGDSLELFAADAPRPFAPLLALRTGYRNIELEKCPFPSRTADCRANNRESICDDRPKPGELREMCTNWHSSVETLSRIRRRGWDDLLFIRKITSNAPAGFRRKQYRTRFGFADGAYRALGPPSGGPSIRLGWYGS